MLCRKMLVAYDDSDLAKKSLAHAVEIAKTNPSIEIHVLKVMKIPAQEFMAFEAYQEIYDHIRRQGQTILSNTRSLLASLPNRNHCCQREGAAADVILSYALENNCDLIIMGSRGLSGIKEFLGSVSHAVVQESPVPVLIIK